MPVLLVNNVVNMVNSETQLQEKLSRCVEMARQKACLAFKDFSGTKCKVLIQDPFHASTKEMCISRLEHFASRRDCQLLILTKVFGSFSGISLLKVPLNVSYTELLNMCTGGVAEGVIFREFFKELDNITSASVLSVLSDTLGVDAFGGAPQLVDFNSCHTLASELKQSLFLDSNQLYVDFFTFVTPAGCFDFLWILDFKNPLLSQRL